MISHRTRISALALLACLTTLGSGAAAEASTPLDGNGMWIWYVNRSGGTAAKIAEKAKQHNVKTVFIKSSDGKNAWSQFTKGLIRKLHREHLKVCGWAFVYGDRPGPEARRSAEVKDKGADCMIIDAETAYEGKYRAADHYMTVLRNRVGRSYPLALAGFPYVDYHPSFPYSVFFRRGGAQLNMPQMYWKSIGTTVNSVFAHTYLWNVPYNKKIFPIGQTYEEPKAKEIKRIPQGGALAPRPRASTGGRGRRRTRPSSARSAAISTGRGRGPQKKYPLLAKRAKGDPVVWLQELLKAWDKKLAVDGDFGNKTAQGADRLPEGHHLKRQRRH